MTINRTSDALWRGPAVAEVEPKRVALSPERWKMIVGYMGRDLFDHVTISYPVEIDGVTFLPAVYYPA